MNKYNCLTVLEEQTHRSRKMFLVQCDCGKVEVKRQDRVISGKTTSCKSCASKRTVLKYPMPVHRTGFKELSGTYYLSLKSGASRRQLEFTVSAEYLYNLWVQQDCKCALTGIPIYLSNKIKNNNVDWEANTASPDRIDNSLGYVEGNIQWVHKRVNRLKNNYSLAELLFWSKLLLDKHGNPDPSVMNADIVVTKEQRLEGEEATDNPSKSAQPPTQEDDIV